MRLRRQGEKDTIDGVRLSDVCTWCIMWESLAVGQLVALERVEWEEG